MGTIRFTVFLALVVAASSLCQAAEVRGKIVNQRTGEPLASVAVSITDTTFSARTDKGGDFSFSSVPAGKYTLRVEAVGFWIQKTAVELSDNDSKEFTISLTPEGARRTEKIDVVADVFVPTQPAEVAQMTLTTSELKQTGTLIAGDPFRSVQALPGVTAPSNNEFFAQFMVLGAQFSEVGVYIDEVLVRQPFHGVSDEQGTGASVGVMNDDTIDTLSLTPLAYSEQYQDAIGGALSIHTREGTRDRTSVGIGVGMAESHATVEGGLPAHRGSWLVSARKSYLGYLTRRYSGSSVLQPSFSDLTARLTYDLHPHHLIDFLAIGGYSNVDNSAKYEVYPNSFFTGASNFSVVRLGWRATMSPNLLLSTFGTFSSQAERTRNQLNQPLDRATGSAWTAGTSMTWNWQPSQTLSAGWTFRRLSALSDSHRYWGGTEPPDSQFSQSGAGTRQGGYVQHSSTMLHGRLQLMGGVRWDNMNSIAIHPVSPQISGSLRVASATSLIWGAGRYRQFPQVEEVSSVPCGDLGPIFTSADHYLAGVEQKFGENTRVRVQAFRRRETNEFGARGLLGTSEPTCGGLVRFAPILPSHKTTRGGQITLQRRSSNRLSGWVSYTFLRQRSDYSSVFQDAPGHLAYTSIMFTGSGDQRSSVNAFGTYRVTPSLNLSAKSLYGSGYPLTLLSSQPSQIFLDDELVERMRTEPFLRLDLRVDKALTIHHQRVTIHGEVLNATNHKNMMYIGSRLVSVNGVWNYYLTETQSLGITPTAGIEIRF